MSGSGQYVRTRRVRLTDVAARANVSIAAVSIALNDRPGVSDAVRQRIREAADELGYRSDRLAASLRTGRTDTVGLVVRNIGNPHYAEMIAVIEDHCAPAGLGILVASSRFEPKRERAAVHDLLDRGVDLLAVTPVGPVTTTALWGPLDELPLILIDADIADDLDTSGLGTVWSRSFDTDAGVRMAVDHLAELGHRQIAILSLTAHPSESKNSAFLDAARRNGVHGEVVIASAPTVAATYEVVSPLLARPVGQRPTAIVFGSDDTALAGYMAAADCGLRIPDDVSLVGSGALRSSAFLNPSLTTVDEHPQRMGESVARLIIDIHHGRFLEPRYEQMNVQLTLGRSTGRLGASSEGTQ